MRVDDVEIAEVGIDRDRRNAVGRDAGSFRELTVVNGCSIGTTGTSGQSFAARVSTSSGIARVNSVGGALGPRTGSVVAVTAVADERLQQSANRPRRDVLSEPAIDVGAGSLRQLVLCTPRVERRRDAGRTQHCI
jgi:hypothetical protein